ncbi:phosphorelay protein [Campylobacter sp. MOP7]|uniref:phosphorelay protein n=1 Tax=Campylobacter canis TaxID=3378588 RepID=UPI00387EA751
MGILKNLEIDYSYDIVEEFLSHYSLMCDIMEPLVIGLAKEDKYKNNIEELSRIFHNIKSAASFMKIEPILKLTVLSEEVCSEAKDLEGPANDKFVDWLLIVSDQFGKYRDDIESDSEFFSVLNPLVVKIPSKLDV